MVCSVHITGMTPSRRLTTKTVILITRPRPRIWAHLDRDGVVPQHHGPGPQLPPHGPGQAVHQAEQPGHQLRPHGVLDRGGSHGRHGGRKLEDDITENNHEPMQSVNSIYDIGYIDINTVHLQ